MDKCAADSFFFCTVKCKIYVLPARLAQKFSKCFSFHCAVDCAVDCTTGTYLVQKHNRKFPSSVPCRAGERRCPHLVPSNCRLVSPHSMALSTFCHPHCQHFSPLLLFFPLPSFFIWCSQPCAHKTSAIASRSSSQFRPRWKVQQGQ